MKGEMELIGGRVYKGNYMSGGGFFMDSLRQLIPLIKGYSKRKIVDFTSNFANELQNGADIKDAFVRSAKQSGRTVVRDITGRGAAKRKKPKRIKKEDFFGI